MGNKKICVIGYFGLRSNQIDGQTIKTREIYSLIDSNYEGKINFIDTQNLLRHPFDLLKLIWYVYNSNILIYLPGENSLRQLYPIIRFFKRKNTKIIYPVVGGWLADFLFSNTKYVSYLKTFDLIGVETTRLKNELISNFNLANVEILTNFRSQPYTPFQNNCNDTLRLVFMARICKEKGTNLIFDLASKIQNLRLPITISFFGKLNPDYEDEFTANINKYRGICQFGGLIQPDKVYETLNRNDLLILPTFYEGEGFPGSILDAYKAGLPVIVSNWKDLPEFVEDGVTGFLFDLNHPQEFTEKIIYLNENRDKLKIMKSNALAKSKEYDSESAWNLIKSYL